MFDMHIRHTTTICSRSIQKQIVEMQIRHATTICKSIEKPIVDESLRHATPICRSIEKLIVHTTIWMRPAAVMNYQLVQMLKRPAATTTTMTGHPHSCIPEHG